MRPQAVGAKQRSRWTKFSDETWAQAEADYRAGATAREISERHGISIAAVYARLGRIRRQTEIAAAAGESAALSGFAEAMAAALHRAFGALSPAARGFVQAVIVA